MKNLFIIILLLTSMCLWAQNVPQTIDYQGRLADSDGTYLNEVITIEFLIYDLETGGTDLWNETQSVSTESGIFHVLLGSVTPFPINLFNNADCWLELIVSGETLSPRIEIASVPYAIKAETAYSLDSMGSGSGLDADMLDGQDSSDFMPATTDNWVDTTGDTMTGQLIVQNNVGIGTTSPTAKLDVNGDVNISGVIDAVGSRANGTFSLVESTLSHTSVHNSILQIANYSNDPASEANIQFAAGYPAHGRATISATHDTSAGTYNGNLNLEVRNGSTSYLKAITIRSSGNVGIGTTNPSEKLSVAGTIETTTGGVKFPDGTIQTTAATTYSIGDFAQGGIVFWVDETGKHGLVCSKSDQDGGSGVRWFAGANGNTQAKGNGPYAGELNTSIIIAAQVSIGDDGSTYAARICNELQIT